MRNWRVAATLSILLASPLCGQQKAAGLSDDTPARAETAADKPSTGAGNAVANDKLVLSKSIFALPAAPRPKPFPKPQAAEKDTRAPGRLLPRYEIAGMYYYLNFSPGGPFANFGNQGAAASFTYNASKYLGLTAEVGGFNFNRNEFPLTGSNTSVNGGMNTFLAGPRLNWRSFDYFVPFAEFLIGDTRGGIELTGADSQNSFSLAAGGGVDVVLTKNLAWRFAQLDYFMTNFSGPALGASARQNNFRAGTGLVLRFGIPNPPPPP